MKNKFDTDIEYTAALITGYKMLEKIFKDDIDKTIYDLDKLRSKIESKLEESFPALSYITTDRVLEESIYLFKRWKVNV